MTMHERVLKHAIPIAVSDYHCRCCDWCGDQAAMVKIPVRSTWLRPLPYQMGDEYHCPFCAATMFTDYENDDAKS